MKIYSTVDREIADICYQDFKKIPDKGTAKLIIDRSPLYILIINWMGCTNEGTYLLSLL